MAIRRPFAPHPRPTPGPHPPTRRWRPLAAAGFAAAAVVAATGVHLATARQAEASAPGDRDVTAVLFEWRFDSIAKECTAVLGPKGYGYVEVSPPQEHIQGSQWWTSYQPVSYAIAGRLGTRAQFKAMVDTCHAAGVKVVADTVINHMTAGSGTGTGGTPYTKYNYPGLYSDADFHACRSNISNYSDRTDVQECELVGLADLNTGGDHVRGRIAGYINDLASLGVDGFRIDAAKHIAASDLAAIKSKLGNPGAYWKQEVIFGAGEAVQPGEYTGTGDVQEFRYATSLKSVFESQQLSYLTNFGEGWGFLPGGRAGVFVDNWDTERNGSTLNHKDGADYTLANVFMLAWPYGSPDVYSGYEFSDNDAGPPGGGTVNACYSDGWKCQHAWRQIANMVAWRNAATGTGVTNWWDDGNDQIAFGRGSTAYVVINHEGGTLTRTFQTSLPAGTYCDVQHGDPTASGGCTGTAYTVDASGSFTASVGANDAVALHVGASGLSSGTATPTPSATGATGAAFAVNATTVWGEDIYVVGNPAALGTWNTGSALLLSSAAYPVWKLTVGMPAGTSVEYKYIKKDGNGAVTWETGANRVATVPASGLVTLNDTWRS